MWNWNAALHVVDEEGHEEDGPGEDDQQYEEVGCVMTSLLLLFKGYDRRGRQDHTVQLLTAWNEKKTA